MKNTEPFIIPEPMLEYWVDIAPGAFSVAMITSDREVQQLTIDRLENLVRKGVLDHYGDKRGWYIPRKNELERIDYINADETPVKIWLPFGMHDLVDIHDGNIIIISGAPNAGKTAMMLNVIKENRADWKVSYFSSEMGGAELKKRLNLFGDVSINNWGFDAYSRSEAFHSVMAKGNNSLNIIDFLEVHDDFFKIGGALKQIHNELAGAIAIVCLQKNPGNDTGLGGYRTIEVARLAVAVDSGKIKIVKAKNYKTDTNPNGLCKDFKLVGGCKIIDKHGWYHERDGGTEYTDIIPF